MAWNLRDLHDALANAGEKIQQMCMAAVEGLPKRGRKIHGLYTCEEQEGMVPAFAVRPEKCLHMTDQSITLSLVG